VKGNVNTDAEYTIPFGKARVVREGSDISLVAYSRMVHVCLEAATELEQHGISAEVVDVRSLLPLDEDTIFNSVGKTNRCVVVYEDWRSGGFGAEIASRVGEKCFDHLDAPVARVAGLFVPTPYARNLELECVPDSSDVVDQARRLF
jgi:pyruvate dehydrogenase E1 component beta subunit